MADIEKKGISNRLSGLKFMQRAAEKRKIEAIQNIPPEEKEPATESPVAPLGYCIVTYESSDTSVPAVVGRRVFGGATLSVTAPLAPRLPDPTPQPIPENSSSKCKTSKQPKSSSLEEIPQLKFFEEAKDFERKDAKNDDKDKGNGNKSHNKATPASQISGSKSAVLGETDRSSASYKQMQQARNGNPQGGGDKKRKPDTNAFLPLRPSKK